MDSQQDEVVISGVGGYFPKAENLEMFKEALLSNESLLETRWNEGERGVSNKIGKCPSIEYFDTAFFGIHRQQATFMDPMQRSMLERTFEALVDAGVNPQDIRGKRIGCFLGSSIGENDNLFYESIVSGFGITGHSRAMMPNRISYWLNLKGPSCAYDSNWINGIEVLQMGFDAVREGHCEAAIIGTANLALNSELSWLYNDMGLLSDDGTTKAFDENAKGYARSDGIIVMYIQRAADAKRAYATIVGTSTQFNGCREGTLLDLDQPSMINFMNDFYKRCKVDPAEVNLLECYGCALKTTDEIELNAIDEVYCKNKKRKQPLMVGSVKTNTGHSEASANLMSLAKVLVAMETGKIPATLQYETPNPNIPGLTEGRLKVVTENLDWDGGYAAVNGIGLASSYAHCLLKSNPRRKQEEVVVDDLELPALAIASTRTEEGIQKLLDTIKDRPSLDKEYIALIQELFTKPISGHLYRGYSILDKEGEAKREFEYHSGNKRQTWFVFSGMGSQWIGMGKDLMKLPMFAESVGRCHEALVPHGVDLIKIITQEDPDMFDSILHSFVGIAAIQIALTDILKALGVTPDGIIGHSVGELGCAYADGCMSAEEMIMCAYSRGRASIEAELIKGMMAAVGLGYEQIKNELPEEIEVACHNSASSCTISGPTEAMEKYVKELQDRGVFARLVNVSNIAYHSRYIKPAAPLLLNYLKNVVPKPAKRSSKWISTSVPENDWNSDLAQTSSPEYHTNNLLSSVLFEEGSKHIPKDSVVIEIAPHGLLQAILKKSLKSGCTNIPLTQRGSKNGLHFLFSAIGKMYLAGLDLNVAQIFPKVDYPVSRGTYGLAPLVHWEHGETWRTGLEEKLNLLVSVKDIKISLASDEFRECIGHQLDDEIVLPLSAYLSFIMKILCTSKSLEIDDVIFENLRFRNTLKIPKVGTVLFYGMIQRGSGEFEILSDEVVIATGKITIPQPTDPVMVKTYEIEPVEGSVELSAEDFYHEYVHRGHKYDGKFKGVQKVVLTEEGSLATITGNQSWQSYLEAMLQQNLFRYGEKYQNIVVPMIIQRINISVSKIPKEDFVSTYDYSTGTVNAEGIQICRLTPDYLTRKPRLVSYDCIDFVPFNNAECDSLEKAINYSLFLTINNFINLVDNNVIVTEIIQKQPSILDNIKNVTSKYTQLQTNLTTTTDPKITIVAQTDPILLISNDEIQEDTLYTIANSEAFALVRTSKTLLSRTDVITLAQFNVDNTAFSLIRKKQNNNCKVIKAASESLQIHDLFEGKVSWAKQLKTHLENLKFNESIYLSTNLQPMQGFYNFVQSVRSHPDYKALKFLFGAFKDDTLAKIIATDNVSTIGKNGILGTYLPSAVEFKKDSKSNYDLSRTILEDASIKYIGINLNNETLHAEHVGLGNIDYVSDGSKQIMGLARLDKDTYTLMKDPIFQWEKPGHFSLDDVCTMPHAYVTAYYSLVIKGRLAHGETVLIHAGCTAIGSAAITIAISYGCQVYTTVATEWQKVFIKNQFKSLRDRNILSSENLTFEPLFLQATGGVGAHVIINCQTGSMMHASVRCMAEYGRFIQLGRLDMRKNNTIGMNVFLRNTAFIGVIPENVFDIHEDDKKEIYRLVQEGLRAYVVRPIYRKIVENQDVAGVIKSLQHKNHAGKILIKIEQGLAMNQLNLNKTNQFICKTTGTNLVIGGDERGWINMVEWLVLRGARKILVTSEANQCGVGVNRRLSLLITNFLAEIKFVPYKNFNKASSIELLSSLYSQGPIQGVYVLPSKDKSLLYNSLHHIEPALRTIAPKAFFVNFFDEVASLVQDRIETGFPTFNVQWDPTLSLQDSFFALDDILSFGSNNIYIKNDKAQDSDKETPQALYKKLAQLLPISAQELVNQALYAPDQPELVQLPSAGPRRIRELPPVVLVTGLSAYDTMKQFAKELLYPIFYTHLPTQAMSIKETARIFAEKIRKLYPRGPYNLIGISWGGALAIEIARILQTFKNTQVTLIDGAPDTIQASIKHLGEGPSYEVSLLNRILNINKTDFLKSLGGMKSWQDRLNAALENYECGVDDKKLLYESLDVLKKRLDDIVGFEGEEEVISGELFLIRPSGSSKLDNCNLSKYFKKNPQITISPGDHLSILRSEVTVDLVNECVTVL